MGPGLERLWSLQEMSVESAMYNGAVLPGSERTLVRCWAVLQITVSREHTRRRVLIGFL